MYLWVRRGCAIAAVVGGAVYFTALWVASADGPGGVVVPGEMSRTIVGAISALLVISLGGWIIDHTHRANIERDTRRVVAEEVNRVRDELAADTRRVVAEEVDRAHGMTTADLQRAIIRAASAARAAAVAEVRETLDEGIREIVESGLKRAEAYGMVREATSRASYVNGTGATVHALRPGEEG